MDESAGVLPPIGRGTAEWGLDQSGGALSNRGSPVHPAIERAGLPRSNPGNDVQLNLARAKENVAVTVQRLVEHAAQVQAKIQTELDHLERVGSQSTLQLAKELQEARDRYNALEMVVKSKSSELEEAQRHAQRLRDQAKAAEVELQKERETRSKTQTALEKKTAMYQAEKAAQEQQHASTLSQLSTSHKAAFDALEQKHKLEFSRTKDDAASRIGAATKALESTRAALQQEKKERATATQQYTEEVKKLQAQVDSLVKDQHTASLKASREIEAARKARIASEAKCKTLAAALEKSKTELATNNQKHRDEFEQLLARISELEQQVLTASQPRRRLSVKFPTDGSAPVLQRNGGQTADDDARIRMLTQQNRAEKRRLSNAVSSMQR